MVDRNLAAFLRVIREGESSQGDDAYRMLFGGKRFDGLLLGHPNSPQTVNGLTSTAAGAYQALYRTWRDFISARGAHDFSPEAQDEFAQWCIERRGAMDDVLAGNLDAAIEKCSLEWASLPGSPYGQPRITLERCRAVYKAYGGLLAAQPETAPEVAAPEVAPGRIWNPEQDGPQFTMGESMADQGVDLTGVAKAAIGVGSMFAGPFGPLVAGLGNALVDAFSPAAKDAIAKGVGKLVPNHPEIGTTVANIVVGAAQELTGKDSPIEAVAEAMRTPETMAQIEQRAVDRINAMLPVMDKLASIEQASWKASEDSIASARAANAAVSEQAWWKSQIFGITLLLLLPIDFTLACVMLGFTPVASDTVSMVIGIVIGTGLGSIISYFYGTTRQSGSKDVLISQLAKGRK